MINDQLEIDIIRKGWKILPAFRYYDFFDCLSDSLFDH